MYPTSNRKLLPYLFYDDLAKAMPWLCDAFGFQERFRLELPNRMIAHAEIEIEGCVVMLGNVGARNAQRPATVRSSLYMFVTDIEAHCVRARAKGAEIVTPPTDQPFGDRLYLALDLEGHEWYFAQHMRDVAIEDLQRTLSGASR